MAEKIVYAPFNIRADKTKPARIVQDDKGNLWLEYYDLEGNIRRIPVVVVFFPQELGDLAAQIPVQDFIQAIRGKIVDSSIMVPVDIQGSYIQVPIDIQGQAIVIVVRDTKDMLCAKGSVDIAAGGTGTVTITASSGEIWEIQFTNHIGSGADISLALIEISPDAGTTFYPVSASHLTNARLILTGGNIIRATFKNAGTITETAVFNVVGRKLQ